MVLPGVSNAKSMIAYFFAFPLFGVDRLFGVDETCKKTQSLSLMPHAQCTEHTACQCPCDDKKFTENH